MRRVLPKVSPVPFAICHETYEGWALEDALTHAARTGYEGVELAPYNLAPRITDLTAADRQRIRDTARRAGIRIAGLHWLLAKTEGFHVTHPDPSVRAATTSYLRAMVDACADLEGRILVFGSPKQRSLLPGVSTAQAWEFATEVFRDVVKQAEDRGVTVCFEPLAPFETDFINTAADARRFAEQFRSAAMKILLDVKAMSSEAIPVPDIIRQNAGAFAHFHANDVNLKGPGFGDVDFRPIAAALREVEYTGWVSVEVFRFDEGPEEIARRSIEYLRATFGS